MKYIKTYENRKNLSPEEKEGNLVARTIQSNINKLLKLKRNTNIVTTYCYFHRYEFDAYCHISLKNWKDIPNINILIDELKRLKCEGYLSHSWEEPFETRNSRIFLLTKQQIEELLLSFKTGLPRKQLRIYKDKLYTYKKFSYRNVIYKDDIIIGNLSKDSRGDIIITGYNLRHKVISKCLKSPYNDDLDQVRLSIPEETEEYELIKYSNNYNL